jgi:hypothetical protein
MVGAIALMLLFVFGMMRLFTRSTERAHGAWNQAMHAMVERFGLTLYPSTAPCDWSAAAGTFRGHHIGFSIVSETESPMRTGVFVQFKRPLAPQVLASLDAQRRFIKRGGNLEVRTSTYSGFHKLWNKSAEASSHTASVRTEGRPLPIGVDDLVATLLEGAYDAEITPERMVVTLEKRRNTFLNYDMLTDPDRLIAAAITALDLAHALEAVDG